MPAKGYVTDVNNQTGQNDFIPLMQFLQKLMLVGGEYGMGIDQRWCERELLSF